MLAYGVKVKLSSHGLRNWVQNESWVQSMLNLGNCSWRPPPKFSIPPGIFRLEELLTVPISLSSFTSPFSFSSTISSKFGLPSWSTTRGLLILVAQAKSHHNFDWRMTWCPLVVWLELMEYYLHERLSRFLILPWLPFAPIPSRRLPFCISYTTLCPAINHVWPSISIIVINMLDIQQNLHQY